MTECPRCGEPIGPADYLTTMPHLGEPEPRAYHLECFMRGVVGSAEHVAHAYTRGGRCDRTCSDAPGLTLRQAARAAIDLHLRLEGLPPFDVWAPAWVAERARRSDW